MLMDFFLLQKAQTAVLKSSPDTNYISNASGTLTKRVPLSAILPTNWMTACTCTCDGSPFSLDFYFLKYQTYFICKYCSPPCFILLPIFAHHFNWNTVDHPLLLFFHRRNPAGPSKDRGVNIWVTKIGSNNPHHYHHHLSIGPLGRSGQLASEI